MGQAPDNQRSLYLIVNMCDFAFNEHFALRWNLAMEADRFFPVNESGEVDFYILEQFTKYLMTHDRDEAGKDL